MAADGEERGRGSGGTTVDAGATVTSKVRERTVERMRRLVGMAAFGAAACSSPKGGSDPGYGVVDPMPMPARCAGGATLVHGTAAFEVDANGKRVLVLRLAPPTDPSFRYVVSPDDPVARADGAGLEARLTVADAATSESYRVSVTCSEGPGALQADISWPSPNVAPGTPLDVQIRTAY